MKDFNWVRWTGVEAGEMVPDWIGEIRKRLKDRSPDRPPESWGKFPNSNFWSTYFMCGNRLLHASARWDKDDAAWDIDITEAVIIARGGTNYDYAVKDGTAFDREKGLPK